MTGEASSGERRARAPSASEQSSRKSRDRRSGVEMTAQQLATRRMPKYDESPMAILIAIGLTLTLAVLCLGVGFSRPLHRVIPLPSAYSQSGHFTYQGPVTSPTPVYPSGFVDTGQPIYPSLVNTVTMKFHYRFASALPHHIHGTVEFRAFLLSRSDTWQEVSTIRPISHFTGDQTTVVSALALSGLYSLIGSVTAQANVAGSTYTADIQPVVHVTGVVDGKAINQTFEPVLPFAVTQNVITLAVSTPVAPPGATYSMPSTGSETLSSLNPAAAGTIPQQVGNVVSIAKYQVSVPFLRWFGMILVGLTLALIGFNEYARRRHTRRTDEELTAARLHVLLVPVVSYTGRQGQIPIDILRFDHLASLAQFLERPILYEQVAGQRTYTVDDDLQRYVYRPAEDRDQGGEDSGSADHGGDQRVHTHSGPRLRRPRRSTLVRGAISLAVVALATTLVTGFTASTTVPASNAGASVQPRLLSQLAPVGCASLSLVSLVQGSGALSNGTPNVLLLGSSGNDTITDTGGGSCIVSGGGSDNITGTTTDICISGSTLNVAGLCPLVSPSNGVTASPTSSNYNNYGGQERLAVTNSAAITAMTIVIRVAQTPGISFNSQGNSYPGGYLAQSSGVTEGFLTYTFRLAPAQSIPGKYPSGTVYAQYGGTGAAHPQSGDTWSVTSTSKGVTSTLTGTF